MSPSAKRAKTETVSLRLDPKTKFMLDYMSRVERRSITALVEQAIRDAANNVGVRDSYENLKTWADFWDASEGVRTLNLISDATYPTDYEEDELLAFTHAHWEFFFTSNNYTKPSRAYVEILWPRISSYLEVWRRERQTDYWAAGREMKADLTKAQLKAPDWPRGSKKEVPNLDDEIPF